MFHVVADEALVVVAAHAQTRLRQVVRAEAEELGVLSDLVGRQSSSRNFDHRADRVFDFDALFGEDRRGSFANDGCLVVELGLETGQRDHDFRMDFGAFLLQGTGRFEDRSRLHRRDFRIDDSQSAAAVTEHRVCFDEFFHSTLHVGFRDAKRLRQFAGKCRIVVHVMF